MPLQKLRELTYQLSQLQSDFDNIFNHCPDILCICGLDGIFKRVNPTVEQILGYTPEEMINHYFGDFVHPDDLDKSKAEMEKLHAVDYETVLFLNRFRCKTGEYKTLSWRAKLDPSTKMIIGVGRYMPPGLEIQVPE